jgi:hypothetical protein
VSRLGGGVSLLVVYACLYRYSDNDTYIFVPEGTDARSLTIHRASGDIVLNGMFKRTF